MGTIKKRRLQSKRIVSLLTAGAMVISTAAPSMAVHATELYSGLDDIIEETGGGIDEEINDGIGEEPGDGAGEETNDNSGEEADADHGQETGDDSSDGTDDNSGGEAADNSSEDTDDGSSDKPKESIGKKPGDSKAGDTADDSEIGATVENGNFETGNFTGWTLLDGTEITDENNLVGIMSNSETYWGSRSFYKEGNYFIEGAPKEGTTGAIRSSSFRLGGDGYIAFLIGGASAENKGSVKLYEEAGDEDTLIQTYVNKNWGDPVTGNTLLRVYDKLDDKYQGKELYFVVENGTDTGGFAFINADDFRASMTAEDVEALYLADAARIRTVEDEYAEVICGLYRDVTFYGTDTKVGEGLATGEAVLEACPEEPVSMEEDTNIDVVAMIREETVIKDQFGIRLSDFDVAINSIIYKETDTAAGTDVKEEAESLVLRLGTYTVSYRISYVSEGRTVTADKSFTIIATERGEAGEAIINGDFEDGFTGWKLLNGKAVTDDNNDVGSISDEETYWGTRNIYKHGDHCLRGDGKEGKAGAIRSSSFKLGGDGYISFLIGAASTEGRGCVRLYEEKGAEDELIKTYVNERWRDPAAGLTLIRVYDRLEEYIGKELYFVVENGSEAGFSFINVDDFRTSLTKDDVIKLQDDELARIEGIEDEYKDYIISCYRKNGIINDLVFQEEDAIDKYEGVTINLPKTIAKASRIVKSYSLENVDTVITIGDVTYKKDANTEPEKVTDGFDELKLKEGTYETKYTREYEDLDGKQVKEDKTFTVNVKKVDPSIREVENGSFETGDLTGWEVINESVWTQDQEGKYKGVISAQTYWGEGLPYNQAGNYHVNGWEVGAPEPETWGIRSSIFTLAGSGYISVRMGGNAAQVKVYKLDGTLIGSFNQTRFKDANFPFAGDGDDKGSWADMGTCFIDLHEYLGEPLYLELRDRSINGGWAHAFFDDVKCCYEEEPDIANGYDTVEAPVSRNEDGSLVRGEVNLKWTSLNNTYVEHLLKLSFEDTGFTVKNTEGEQESAELESVFKEPAYQDAPVEPYRPAGVVGKALNFDGYSNYAEFNETVEGRELTIDAYVAPRAFMWDSPSSPHEERIIETIAGSYDKAAKKGFVLGVTKHGHLAFRVGTGNNWYSLSSDADHTTPLYEWSRVTAVFDGGQGVMRLYLNGELAAEELEIEEGSEIALSGRAIRIGKGSEENLVADNIFDGTMFPGLMDEITISLTAMTDEEVKEAGWELPELAYEDAKAPDSALAGDWYRPTYHAVPPASWMNEPHALFQYKGKWHLFYQTNQGGPFWHNISWGHWVSDDMVNWKCVKDAVVPTEGTVSPDGVWTGNMIWTSDGEPLLLITLGDDSRPVNGSNQHVGLVRAVDYSDPDLTEWEIIGYAVAQTPEMGTAGEFRDAQAFGIGNERYMVVGGAADGKGVAHVFKTTARSLAEWEAACSDSNVHNGMNWEYKGNLLGDFFANNAYDTSKYGTVWEMPNIVPLCYEDGTETGKYLFVFSPQHGDNDVWYYTGTFDSDTCRFTPDYADAKLMDYGDNIFTGPTVYVNPSDGKVYICSIMQDNAAGENGRLIAAHKDAGWAFYAGLPRELYLKEDGSLGIKNIDTFSVEGQTLASFSGLSVADANAQLAGIASDTVKIEFEFTGDASEVGFRLKKSGDNSSKFFITKSSVGLDQKSGAYTRENTVTGVIYVDKCSIEAYVDEAVTVSGNKFFRGTGLEIFAEGDATCTVTVTQMNSIHGNAGAGTRPGVSGGIQPEDVPKDVPDGLWVAGVEETGYAYTGKQIKPEVRVYDRDQLLKAGQDYTITYKNNTKAYALGSDDAGFKAKNAPTIVVKGKGNYKGQATQVFKINPVDLSSPEVLADDIAVAYNNKVQKKVPTVTYNGKKLANKKDFTVSYPDLDKAEIQDAYKAAGTYDIVLTAKAGGNYTGTRTVKLVITNSRLISKASVTKVPDQTYDGTAKEPELTIKVSGQTLTKETDYTVEYKNNTEIGVARAVITGKGDYAGTKTITFKIVASKLQTMAEIDQTNWKSEVAYDVRSREAVQDVNADGTSKVGLVLKQAAADGKKALTEGTDYEVSYLNNAKPGTATMVFTGVGKYAGVLKKTFKVTKVQLNAADSKLKYAVASQAAYAKKGAKAAVTVKYDGVTLKEGTDYRLTYKNNKAVTAADVADNKKPQVTITGTGAFSGSILNTDSTDQVKDTTFKVVKANLSAVNIAAKDVVYKNKAGKFMSAPVLTDVSGGKLKKGSDYTLKYYVLEADAEGKKAWTEKTASDIVGLTETATTDADGNTVTVSSPTTVKVVATAAGSNYTENSQTFATYRVTKADISKAKVTIASQVYTGRAIKPGKDAIKVKVGSDQLTFGEDYEIVSYDNNVRKGTASVTIKGIGNYGGTRKASFKITSRVMAWWQRLMQ